MRFPLTILVVVCWIATLSRADEPNLIVQPDAYPTLVNPACSHCVDEAKRRAKELQTDDRILAWTRGYSEGGAIPFRFFLNQYRVISDSYGVFVSDPDAGFARGFAPSYEFRFHGWRKGVMVLKHADGTLYSSLSGVAFAGPRQGTRLKTIPTIVSDWGWWLKQYPNAVAYHMFEKYQPVELPAKPSAESVQSREKPDSRLSADTRVLGIWTGRTARAYPQEILTRRGLIIDEVDGEKLVLFWEPTTQTASAYRPIATQPRKFQAPNPDASGVSPADAGIPIPAGTPIVADQKVTLKVAAEHSPGRFQDQETQSYWDVAGRCVAGQLKGYTLAWVDSVQVRWFAWAAEYPQTSLYEEPKVAPVKATPKPTLQTISGKAEFLRLLPKPFAIVRGIDTKTRTISLLLDGEKEPKTWPVEPDAEIKVRGWWGRLDQFREGDRVWVWLKLNRQKSPVSVLMLADSLSEWDMHASLRSKNGEKPRWTPEEIERQRAEQKAWLRNRWLDEGLPGTLTFHHVLSGELELTLDHEAIRWGRSLSPGDVVQLSAQPQIQAVVKTASPWRERTVVRLVVGELESSELKIGERLTLRMKPLGDDLEQSPYPLDIDRPRTKSERIEWFLASTYCTCGINKDTCTGHFYTLASCNPNGCGMPNHRREVLAELIDEGLTDRQIFDRLLKESGPLLLKPHLMP